MRILNVTQSYYPFLARGGPTVKVRAIARGMADARHQVTVLTVDLGFDQASRKLVDPLPGRWGLEAHQDGAEIIYLRTRAHYRAVTWNPGIASFCKERLASCDVTHIYGLYDLIGPKVAKECRRRSLPYVVEPMGMFRPIVRNIPMKRLYHAFLGNALLKGASRIIATAEQEREELLAGGIVPEKIVVRRNGIDVPDRFPPSGRFRDQWDISKDVRIVLFLGRLVSKKSPNLMLEAFAGWLRRSGGSRPSMLVLAGPDEGGGYRQQLEATAAQLGLNGGVLFTGPLYGEAKWAAYRDADLFVLPSQNENFGNTAAEAVAAGTPVMVTDRCGIAPIVDRRAGLVVPHDRAALEAGLGKILDDTAFAERLRAGCAEVSRSLGWAAPLAEMESLYKEVMHEGGPG
jgi:glycosyltransferase involved in cell wall biosynthesis